MCRGVAGWCWVCPPSCPLACGSLSSASKPKLSPYKVQLHPSAIHHSPVVGQGQVSSPARSGSPSSAAGLPGLRGRRRRGRRPVRPRPLSPLRLEYVHFDRLSTSGRLSTSLSDVDRCRGVEAIRSLHLNSWLFVACGPAVAFTRCPRSARVGKRGAGIGSCVIIVADSLAVSMPLRRCPTHRGETPKSL